MKITANREKLLTAFAIAAAVSPAKSTKPILRNVKLEASDGSVVMMGTDTEIGVRVKVEGASAAKSGTGVALLPVDRFGAILRELSDEKLTITATPERNTIQGARSRFQLATANPAEFPAVPEFDATAYHSIGSQALRCLIHRTLFAVGLTDRFALGGIMLELGKLVVGVGSDGRRLAKMEVPGQAIEGHATSKSSPTIVPYRGMHLLERALGDLPDDEEVHLAALPNTVHVRSSRFDLSCRLIEGRYPDWRSVIPQRSSEKVALTVGPLHSCVRQAAIVLDKESRGVDFTFGDGKLIVHGQCAEAGESRVEIPIAYDGAEITATLDHRYVAEFLKVLPVDRNITVDVINNEQAVLFSTDDGYQYVVMPITS